MPYDAAMPLLSETKAEQRRTPHERVQLRSTRRLRHPIRVGVSPHETSAPPRPNHLTL
jgi:hypothetical protein